MPVNLLKQLIIAGVLLFGGNNAFSQAISTDTLFLYFDPSNTGRIEAVSQWNGIGMPGRNAIPDSGHYDNWDGFVYYIPSPWKGKWDFSPERDTLYLLFDPTDSLQVKQEYIERSGRIYREWNWLRTPEDLHAEDYYDNWLGIIRLTPDLGVKTVETLSIKELRKFKNVMTRKEFMSFYDFESWKRRIEKQRNKDRKRRSIILIEFPFSDYFKNVFLIEPQPDGSYLLHNNISFRHDLY